MVLRRVWQSLGTHFPDFDYDWRPQAMRLSVPTLVVHGTDDPLPIASAEEWAATLPTARLVAIPDAGHYPHAEQSERFFRVVEAFLSGR